MTTPAKWRPSSLPSLALCPGWLSAPGTTDAAERGTRIHAAIADVVSGRAPVPTEANDEAEAVRFALSVVSDMREAFPDRTFLAEQPVDAGVPGVHGTADLVGVDGWSSDPEADVLVADWKSGWGDHGDAASSLQLVAYALGAIAKFGGKGGARLYLVDLDKRTATVCRWSPDDLAAAKRRIIDVITRAETATTADLRPSKEACRYCARKTTCPAATAAAVALDATLLPKAVDELAPEAVADLLDDLSPRVALAATVLDALKERARALMADGVTVPGWSLKQGSARKSWASSAAEVQAAVQGVDLLDIVTPAEAERRVAKALGGSREAKRQAFETLAPLVKKTPTAPSVVRADEGAEA